MVTGFGGSSIIVHDLGLEDLQHDTLAGKLKGYLPNRIRSAEARQSTNDPENQSREDGNETAHFNKDATNSEATYDMRKVPPS